MDTAAAHREVAAVSACQILRCVRRRIRGNPGERCLRQDRRLGVGRGNRADALMVKPVAAGGPKAKPPLREFSPEKVAGLAHLCSCLVGCSLSPQ